MKTRTHRALMICFELDDEVEFVIGTLCNYGFHEDIVQSVIRDKISDFSKIKPDLVQRCPVYFRLPWFTDVSNRFANQISACVRKCYFSSNLRVVFRTRAILTSGRKDFLLPRQRSSSLIYSLRYVCGSQYIGRINQRLDSRMKQHVPTKILC